jgi:hypothetical protein
MSYTKKLLTQNVSTKLNPHGLYHPEGVNLFKTAKEHYTIPFLWRSFGYPGKPSASCKSPFRDDDNPSFSVFDEGRKWKDHATGDGGDIIEFLKFALGGGGGEVHQWLRARLSINTLDRKPSSSSSSVLSDTLAKKEIEWPGELLECNEDTWNAFAKKRGYCCAAVSVMVRTNLLRFLIINGKKCFVVLDGECRAAEIRAIDRTLFYGRSKTYPLKGVDKTWLVGANMLCREQPDVSVLVCEGATDLLTAVDLYYKYRRRLNGKRSWLPVTLLGAGCKKLAPECAKLIAGRNVRIVPDADQAGAIMAEQWQQIFHGLGCHVETVMLDPGLDLTDAAPNLNLQALFS